MTVSKREMCGGEMNVVEGSIEKAGGGELVAGEHGGAVATEEAQSVLESCEL